MTLYIIMIVVPRESKQWMCMYVNEVEWGLFGVDIYGGAHVIIQLKEYSMCVYTHKHIPKCTKV